MLGKLKTLFGKPQEKNDDAGDVCFAVAALLVEAARADQQYDERERALIDRALAAEFSIDADSAARLRAKAEEAQGRAHDIHRFTKIAKTLSPDEKTRLVEILWRIVLSDGGRDPYEDALIRRVCGLIYFSDVDSGAARKRVENELQNQMKN